MKPLVVLISVFLISLLVTWLIGKKANYLLSGRIALAVMLLFTSIGHFKFPEGMAMMLPAFVPAKEQVILLTGIIEILAAVGILIPKTQKLTGVLLILFFVLILPANIYAAIKHVDLEKGSYDGSGPGYLWFRVPLQVFFIIWTWWFVVRKAR